MRRGTTPTFTFEVEDLDLTGWDVYVSFKQGTKDPITRKQPEIVPANDGGCICSVELTQAETLEFKAGKQASAQLRAYKDNVAVASTIFEFGVGEILLDGEIPQEV